MQRVKFIEGQKTLKENEVFKTKYEASKKAILSDKDVAWCFEKLKRGNEIERAIACKKLYNSSQIIVLETIAMLTNDENLIKPLEEKGFEQVLKLIEEEIDNAGRERFYRFVTWC